VHLGRLLVLLDEINTSTGMFSFVKLRISPLGALLAQMSQTGSAR